VDINTRVKELREDAGFTQAQLAFLLGVSEKTIRRWESDPGDTPRPRMAAKLAKRLGVTVEALGFGAE
jgi:DNA-binding XRE family transcriptional regulator